MRADVKLGVIVSLVTVLVAGGYFLARDADDQPISLDKLAAGTGDKTDQSAPSSPNARRATVPRAAQPKSNTPAATTAKRSPASGPAQQRTARGPDGAANRKRGTTMPGSPGMPKSAADRQATGKPGPDNAAPRRSTPTQRPPDRSPLQAGRSVDPGEAANRTEPVTTPTSGDALASSEPNSKAESPRPVLNRTRRLVSGGVDDASVAAPGRSSSPLADATLSATPPPAAAVETHRVQPGDTLASLSTMYYGSERYVPDLIRANPQITNPGALRVGSTVRIPPLPESNVTTPAATPAQSAGAADSPKSHQPESTPGRTYRVKAGDSFYVIARDLLGDAKRWKELYELNRELVKGDPTKLQVNQVITLPK